MTNTSLASRSVAMLLRMVIAALLSSCVAAFAQEKTPRQEFNIAGGDAKAALKQFSSQTKDLLLASDEAIAGVTTHSVRGRMTSREALDTMLANTGLRADFDAESRTFAVRKETALESKNVNRAIAHDSGRPGKPQKVNADDEPLKLDTFEVMGSKLLNMDIPRSRDAIQPYVVFGRSVIEKSGATNLQDFLKNRLSMNAVGFTGDRLSNSASGNASQINLRGLGGNQTLILIDGHRAANLNFGTFFSQPDLNGIPLSAIERIEVLPTTASGIYGGNATGGVVNVVLRRDYAGAELKSTYENSFDTDTAIRRIDINAGFTLERGKTNVLLAASYSDQNVLTMQDRDFETRGRATIFSNTPGFFTNATNPPLGATPNIRSSTGVNLTLKSGAVLNSPITFVPSGYAGAATDGGAALAANAGRYNLSLAPTAQLSGGALESLSLGPKVETFTAAVRRQFGENFQAFVDLGISNNTALGPTNSVGTGGIFTLPITAPTNPFAQPVRVTVPIAAGDGIYRVALYSRRAAAGFILRLPREWQVEADYNWNRLRAFSNRPNGTIAAGAATAVNAGALDILQDPARGSVNFVPFLFPEVTSGPVNSILRNASMRLAGPAFALPAGSVVLSSLLEYRDEAFGESLSITPGGSTFYNPPRSQTTYSAYLETKIPIASKAKPLGPLRGLDLQLAGRFDDYSAAGATGNVNVAAPVAILRATNDRQSVNPTFGLRAELPGQVVLRASYGTGFLPPAVNQLVPNAPVNTSGGFSDPKRGGTLLGPYSLMLGGDPILQPEESESISSGLVLTDFLKTGLRISLDYTRIRKTDNIISLTTQQIIDNENLFPGRVIRGPANPGDPPGFAGPVTAVDQTLLNLARTDVTAYDLAVDYTLKTRRAGSFDGFLAATWQPHFLTQILPTAAAVETAGVGGFPGLTTSTPLKLRANGGITWRGQRWSVGWVARYFDSYLVSATNATILSQGSSGRIASQTYHDIFVAYDFGIVGGAGGGRRLLGGAEIQVGVKNVFNREPPFDAGNAQSFYSYFGDPRLSVYQISVKKKF